MCIHSQLKKKGMCNLPPPLHSLPPPYSPATPQGVNGTPYVPKLYASSGIDISKCIEGGSIKFTTLVDYI